MGGARGRRLERPGLATLAVTTNDAPGRAAGGDGAGARAPNSGADPADRRRARRARTAVPHPVLVHNDLNSSNIQQLEDGRPALLDFERSFAGHPDYDRVKLDWLLAQGCDDCARAFGTVSGDVQQLVELYRMVYAVDMAAYLVLHATNDADRALLDQLLRRLHEGM
ncbi:MAG: phosphotransferase [Kofleriaceae bacterium]